MPEELEALKLNRSLGRALENNTALSEAVSSKDDLIKDLNSRIKQVQRYYGSVVCLSASELRCTGPEPASCRRCARASNTPFTSDWAQGWRGNYTPYAFFSARSKSSESMRGSVWLSER